MRPFIVYDSLTGNVERFVNKLDYESIKISNNLIINRSYILITYTIGHGEIPKSTNEFLDRNSLFLSGVACSGNRNWGNFFGRSGKLISTKYQVPLIHIFELSGNSLDLKIFKEEVERICQLKSQNG